MFLNGKGNGTREEEKEKELIGISERKIESESEIEENGNGNEWQDWNLLHSFLTYSFASSLIELDLDTHWLPRIQE